MLGQNIFAYVGGNPLSMIDPEGYAGKIPKNYGKGKLLPPTDQLPRDANRNREANQERYENDSWKCLFMPCEAIEEIRKATICLQAICTTCEGSVFYTGPKAPQASAFDPSKTTCKCIEYGLNPDYQGGPPPGLTPPGR